MRNETVQLTNGGRKERKQLKCTPRNSLNPSISVVVLKFMHARVIESAYNIVFLPKSKWIRLHDL